MGGVADQPTIQYEIFSLVSKVKRQEKIVRVGLSYFPLTYY